MELLMMILKEIDDSVDFKKETALIDGRILDSFSVITLISELEEAFDVRIDPAEIVPQNFNSAEAMWAMIQRLSGV